MFTFTWHLQHPMLSMLGLIWFLHFLQDHLHPSSISLPSHFSLGTFSSFLQEPFQACADFPCGSSFTLTLFLLASSSVFLMGMVAAGWEDIDAECKDAVTSVGSCCFLWKALILSSWKLKHGCVLCFMLLKKTYVACLANYAKQHHNILAIYI